MRLAALAAALALVAATGCRRRSSPARRVDAATDAAAAWRPPTVVLDRVAVVPSGDAVGAVVEREYGRRLARCLIEAGVDVVALPSQAGPDRRLLSGALTLELDGVRAGDELTVTATATLAWSEATELPLPRVVVAGAAALDGDPVATAAYAIAAPLLEPVCRGLAAQLALLSGDLGPGLASDDPTLVSWALTLAPSVRNPDVPAQVVALIDRPSPIGDTALATLVALGDRAVVPALIARIELAERAALPVRLDAVASLGGPDAEDFLRVLADHADPVVAARARAGLARLGARYSPSQ